MKRLIINADDFGFTRSVNSGIIHAHREGVLTSTTLMANGDAFDDAVRLAYESPALGIGCHLVLVQGQSLLTGRPLPGRPHDLLLAITRGHIDVYGELRSQIEKILAVGIRLTHLDSHKHTHIVPAVFRAAVRLAHEFRIPYIRLPIDAALPVPDVSLRFLRRYYERLARDYDVKMTDHFLGFRLTGSLTEDSLLMALATLPDGTTEFMCHPGFMSEELSNAPTRLKQSRERELEALISPRVREAIRDAGVHLGPFPAEYDPSRLRRPPSSTRL